MRQSSRGDYRLLMNRLHNIMCLEEGKTNNHACDAMLREVKDATHHCYQMDRLEINFPNCQGFFQTQ